MELWIEPSEEQKGSQQKVAGYHAVQLFHGVNSDDVCTSGKSKMHESTALSPSYAGRACPALDTESIE